MRTRNTSVIAEIDKAREELLRQPSHFFAPSEFWNDLCEKHSRKIAEFGFDSFKRHINFEYGQWSVTSLFDWQVKHLLNQLLRSRRIPYVPLFSRIGDTSDVVWTHPGRLSSFAYRVYVSLLWQLAASRDELGCLIKCEESPVGRPIPISYFGRTISQDLAQSALELNFIAKSADLSKVRNVAEIGAGSGRFAQVFMQMYPDTSYAIFDIPPALVISQNHLAGSMGDSRVIRFGADSAPTLLAHPGKVAFHLPQGLADVPDKTLDLCLNVSSFDEMVSDQVEMYLDLIDIKCKGWLYLKGYANRIGKDQRRPWGLLQFPYPHRWQLLSQGVDPVYPDFIERLYWLP